MPTNRIQHVGAVAPLAEGTYACIPDRREICCFFVVDAPESRAPAMAAKHAGLEAVRNVTAVSSGEEGS